MNGSGLPGLDRRLRMWSRQWNSTPGVNLAADQLMVNDRVRCVLQRLFGAGMAGRVESTSGPDGQLLMPVALPLFNIFLGRRAARELSRKVLANL